MLIEAAHAFHYRWKRRRRRQQTINENKSFINKKQIKLEKFPEGVGRTFSLPLYLICK